MWQLMVAGPANVLLGVLVGQPIVFTGHRLHSPVPVHHLHDSFQFEGQGLGMDVCQEGDVLGDAAEAKIVFGGKTPTPSNPTTSPPTNSP